MKNKKPARRSRFKMGLRSQQVVLFLLVSLTPLLIVSLTIRKLGGDALKSSVGEGMVSLARVKLSLADRAISHKISNIRTELRQEGLQLEVAKSNNANGNKNVFDEVKENLEDSMRLLETYAGGRRRGYTGGRRRGYRSEVTITNAEGYALRSNNRELNYDSKKELPPMVNKKQIWWIKARNNGNGSEYVEDVTYDTQRNVHRLLVALPIRMGRQRPSSGTQNKIVGICKAILYLPELADLVELQPGTDKTYTILTNQSGKIIATPQESEYHIGDQISMENATMRAIIEAKKDEEYDQYYYGYEAASETDRFNESRVYGWARTRPVSWHPWKRDQNFGNWIIFVSYPSSEAYAGVVKLNQYVLWLTILSCVIVIPFAYVVAKRISQPVMQLAQAAKRIGQEAKDVVQEESDQVRKQIANMQWYQNEESELISIGSKNEVGMLAQEFNDMHRNLKIAVEKLISAEQQMTTIVDCLGEGLIVVDTRDRILYFNPAAKHLLNFNETSQFPDLFTELLSITNLTVLANTHGQDTRATVEINLDQEGENRILRVVTSQFTSVGTTDNGNSPSDENTDMAGMVYVFDDITRQHEIDKMKSDFVALVSHELRTPLTSIIGFISLILDGKAGPLNEVQQQSLTRAHRQSERLATMINDLLDISRIEAGRIVMKLEPVNLTEIAQQRLEELKPQADEKTIKLDMNVQPDLPELTGDAEHLGQILTNLVGNAIKFTPSNGEVHVRMSRKNCPLEDGVMDENDGVHLEVIDTGPGIPAQDREDVFDKFRQLSNIQTREQGGTGLGLAIARGFVEAHKGKIWVDAGKNDKGCNFQFWIPFLS
ncbi:MAG: ATP-binding protein [Candidatus Poribacteria bacterium]|nr:ATP-binding protein [Candidatus Poribacteria bacterium]